MWLYLMVSAALAAPVDAVSLLQQGASVCAATHLGDGRVLTAYHCVVDGRRAKLTTARGEVVRARVHRVDRRTDLAVLSAKGLVGTPALALAPSSPGVGEPIFAWGHPLGAAAPSGFMAGTLRWSVSQGIVAALGPEAIQTTAALNPGNSGGPLVDEADAVVGVASRKLRAQSLGFATRVERARELVDGRSGAKYGVGGSLAAGLSLSDLGGQLAVGATVDLVTRGVFVVSTRGELPLGARWAAVQTGETQWLGGQVRAGVRRTLGHGTFATRLELLAGAASRHTLNRAGDGIALRGAQNLEPIGVLGVAVGGVGVEAGWVGLPADGQVVLAVRLGVPGVFSVW